MRPLTSYHELISVLENLPMLVLETRRRQGLTLREAAEKTGVSTNSLNRFERGKSGIHSDGLLLLLKFVSDQATTPPDPDPERDAVNRLARVGELHTHGINADGVLMGICMECGRAWPCATYQWVTDADRDPLDWWTAGDGSDDNEEVTPT
jgi:hypothetical protein